MIAGYGRVGTNNGSMIKRNQHSYNSNGSNGGSTMKAPSKATGGNEGYEEEMILSDRENHRLTMRAVKRNDNQQRLHRV